MKTPTLTLRFFLLCLLLHVPLLLSAQDWQWQWGVPDFTAFRTMSGIQSVGTDCMNNVYACYGYLDSLDLHDTVFRHATGRYTLNQAIVFYREDGTFLHAIDLYSIPFGNVWNTMARTDTHGNLYIASEFQLQVSLMDTVIQHGPAPYEGTPNIFIAKLDPERQVKWVRLIWGTTQARMSGFLIGNDQQLYLGTTHYGNGGSTESVHFFGTDSATYTRTLQCVLKLDTNGNLAWKKEIRTTDASGNSRELISGNDGNFYHLSETNGNYYVDGETVPVPGTAPLPKSIPCILKFSPAGSFLGGLMVNNGLMLNEIKPDEEGNLYYSGYATDTVILASDTLVPGTDSAVSLVGLANPEFVSNWYHTIKFNYNEASPVFQIVPIGDELCFGFSFKKTFTFAGQTFQFGYITRPVIGKLLPGGILGQYILGTTNDEMLTYDLVADNCKNLLFSGSFRGIAYVGRDTLHGYFSSSFIGSIRLHPPADPGLMADTSVCEGITLHATPGYSYYSWNGGISLADTLRVNESGWYRLSVHDENYCWSLDSVNVVVTIPPEIMLGADTAIYTKDSLVLSLPTPYDHCLWSTGDTTSSITVKGKELGKGVHTVSVTMIKGPCTVTDSIRIIVNWSPGMKEESHGKMFFYPNPVTNTLVVRLPAGPCELRISDPDGKPAGHYKATEHHGGVLQADLSSLLPGLYFLELISGDAVQYAKIIKQ